MLVDALNKKIQNWCSIQERSCNEVHTKLSSLGIPEEDIPYLIGELKEEGFINQTRFARQFAGGKFRIKAWGKMKIQAALFDHGLDEKTITEAIEDEISQEDYLRVVTSLIDKELGRRTNDEIIRLLVNKGFERDLVEEMMENLGIK